MQTLIPFVELVRTKALPHLSGLNCRMPGAGRSTRLLTSSIRASWMMAVLMALSSALASAQPVVNFPTTDADYFQYVLTSIVDSERPAEELQQRRQFFIDQMRLDANEINLLLQAANEFDESLRGVRAQVDSLLRSKAAGAALTAGDRASLANLASSHEAIADRLGRNILQRVRPETARRIRAAIRNEPYPSKGEE